MLDVKTAFLMWSIQALALCFLLLIVWFHDRSQRHFLLFGIGFGCNSLGGLSKLLNGITSDVFTIYLGNALMFMAFFFWANGLRLFDGRKFSLWPIMPVVAWCVSSALPPVFAEFSSRLIVYALCLSLGHLFMASALLNSGLSSPKYRHILAGIWILQSMISLAFGVYGFVYRPSSMEQVPFLGTLVVMFVVGMVSTIVLFSKIIMDRSEWRLKQLSITDPLTGVLNRRGLIEAASNMQQKLSKDHLLALLVFDLDHFKSINDTHGHQVGDAVLSSFAEMVSSIITKARTNPAGLFARSGGEEFCTLIPVESLRQAAGLAEQIRTMVANTPIVAESRTVRLTVSIGVSAVNAGEFNFDTVMSQADHGLYKAKADGRNRTAIARGESIYCIGPGLEPGSPAAIDHDADLQVAALRRLTKRQLHPDA